MLYPGDFEPKIGFDSIRRTIIDLCTSRLAVEEARNMSFSTNYSEVMHRLGTVSEMLLVMQKGLPFPTLPSHDVAPGLMEIRAIGSYMSAEKLYHLMLMLRSFSEISDFFNSQREENPGADQFPELLKELRDLHQFPALISTISRAIDKYGEIKDTASPALYEIRQAIKQAGGSVQRTIKKILDRAIAAGIVDKDAAPTMRDGRFVIPVGAAQKRSISGIIHDESATGKTVFIEPVEVVEAGNRLRELQLEEKREEVVVLTAIADEIRPFASDILASCRILASLEFITAKARFADDVDAQMPTVVNKPELEWYHAVHPSLLLSLREQGREVVPLNITLSGQNRILIISGPNAGGKSVTLKTVAAVQYMMQCGLLPTLYSNSHMGFFKNLFIDIGDEQSLENDLSTYSSHLKNMKFFLSHADKHTLLLADEMGSGTEPLIGGAIAQAMLDKFGKSGCYGIITTHYQNLKKFADDNTGFINGAMLYDKSRLQPTFQLSIGNAGSSFAIDIAHKMGLPNDVIEEARKIAGEDYINFDKYLSDIARDRKYWANKRQNIREKENRLDNLLSKYEEEAGDLISRRKAILRHAQQEAAEIVAEANARIERTILEIRNSQAEKEKTKQLRKELKEFAEATAEATDSDKYDTSPVKQLKHKSRKARKKAEEPVKTGSEDPGKDISVGKFVVLDDGKNPGKVLSITGKKAEVAFGALRTFVELSRLKTVKAPKSEALSSDSTIGSRTLEESRKRQLNFSTKLDVRGMRADEALQAVTYFLDDAIQFNAGRVMILHGTGHGILKTLIRQQLKSTPGIDHFEDEDIRFGGAGITVVTLS